MISDEAKMQALIDKYGSAEAFYSYMETQLPPNGCGECTACCYANPIAPEQDADIAHGPHKPCKYLCGKGCTIYDKRPIICRSFFCLWRLHGWVNKMEQYRPDKLGILIDVSHLHSNPPLMEATELWDGAFNDPRYRYILQKLQLTKLTIREFPYSVCKDAEAHDRYELDGRRALTVIS